jgi:nucleotidyltransferase/DNA polymerase involved in DNA repair
MDKTTMIFPPAEAAVLLQVKGVGPTVIRRLEQIGISSLAQLQYCEVSTLAQTVADLLRSSCWKNSPQAKAALVGAIAAARHYCAEETSHEQIGRLDSGHATML